MNNIIILYSYLQLLSLLHSSIHLVFFLLICYIHQDIYNLLYNHNYLIYQNNNNIHIYYNNYYYLLNHLKIYNYLYILYNYYFLYLLSHYNNYNFHNIFYIYYHLYLNNILFQYNQNIYLNLHI